MRKKKRLLGPIAMIFILMASIMVVTSILSIMGYEGKQATIVGGELETYLVTVNNIFSYNGIKYFFSNCLTNIQNYQPLIMLIISLITISVMDISGLLKNLSNNIKKLKLKYLTILVLIISMICVYIGDYSYAFLIPLVGIVYKNIGKNPILGIITVFSGLTLSYGLSFLYNNYTLGLLTEVSARVDVDANYTFSILSTIYIAITAVIASILICTGIIEKRIAPKFNNPILEEDDKVVSKVATQYAMITFLSLLVAIVYLIVPSPYSGFLLDKSQNNYFAQLFGNTSPFGIGLPYILMLVIMLCSFVYGKVSKNITSSVQYSEGLSSAFDNTGYMFVLMFFISQLAGLVEWTNIGTVLSANILDFMSSLEFSGIPLLIISFVLIIFVSLFIPSSITKWSLLSPIIIPLFMRANITPEFTQFVFTAADSIGKMVTPIFPYYVVLLGFIYKYKGKDNITLFSPMKLLLPITLVMSGIFLLIILSWFLIGLPLGINVLPSL